MTDYRAIRNEIHDARLEQFAFVGELIATGVFTLWTGVTRAAKIINQKIDDLVRTPDEYSTGFPHF